MRQSDSNTCTGGGAQIGAGEFFIDAGRTCVPMVFTDPAQAGNPVVFANTRFLTQTGYTSETLFGRPIRDLLQQPVRGSSILSALEDGAEGSWHLRCFDADRREFSATVFNCPVHSDTGQLTYNALTFFKLDENLSLLAQERVDFRAIFDQAPGFVAIGEGPNHRYTFANISYKNFVGCHDLEGRTVVEVFPELVDQGIIDLLDNVYRTGEPYIAKDVSLEFVNPATGEPERKYADFIYQPIPALDGTILGIFCEGYDVTIQHDTANHLAALQADLIHVSRANAMGTMAVMLAHELNQPLAAIVNYADGAARLVDTAQGGAALLSEALQGISDAAHNASILLRNLRQMTTRRPVESAPFNLKEVVAESIRLVSIVAHSTVEFTDQVPVEYTIKGDRIQVEQVLINVLRNACDAMETSGARNVTITAFESQDQIVVSVIDTGAGVTLEAAETMFALAESTKRDGMGVGLSICRTILDNLGGRIWLETSDATGTEMRFSLPRYRP